MIELAIKVKPADIERMLTRNGFEITDREKFAKIVTSKKFARSLADDMLTVWRLTNEEGDMDFDVIEKLGLDKVVGDGCDE